MRYSNNDTDEKKNTERYGRKIKVELIELLDDTTFSSDTIELQPRHEVGTLKVLQQLYSLIVNATFINNVTNEKELIFVGIVSHD